MLPLLLRLSCVLLAFTPFQAGAALIDLGDITRDTTLDLDWLDPTESTGFSYNAVEAGAGGFTAAGWRHADETEVCSLFVRLGMTPPCPSPTPDTPTSVFDPDLAGEIEALLGSTGSGAFFRIDAMFDDGLAGDGQTGLAQALEFSNGVQFFVRDDQYGSASISANVGHFLVRPIPEPATGLLLLGGLLALPRAGKRR